jgi:hypothetical protein
MRKQTLLLTAVIITMTAISQNPATVFTIPNKTIVLPCGTNCTPISVSVPHIKQSTTYVVTKPAYLPFAYTTPTGTELINTYLMMNGVTASTCLLPSVFAFMALITLPCLLGPIQPFRLTPPLLAVITTNGILQVLCLIQTWNRLLFSGPCMI